MSKPKKHKHTSLSTEKLFDLLENNSGKATDFDGMDDFEKEALEGFTNYSTPEKTRAMVEEVNLSISKKIDEEAGTKKNKVIWFSAAASVVLLILISVFFLNQSKKDTASTIALNEVTPPPTVQPTISAPDAGIKAAEPVDETNNTAGQTSGVKTKEEFKQDLASRMETQEETKPGAGLSKEIVTADAKNSEESINTATFKGNVEAKDLDALKKNESETADKFTAVKPAVNSKNQTESANGYTSPSAVNSNASSAPVTIAQNTSKYDDKTVEERAKKSKAREKSPAYESEMDQEVEVASYKGGEADIKAYVDAYLQKMSLTVTGKYKVKANVLTNGRLKVKVVNHITNEVCKDCENTIKKALNEMTGWTPAFWGKTASESSVDFILLF